MTNKEAPYSQHCRQRENCPQLQAGTWNVRQRLLPAVPGCGGCR